MLEPHDVHALGVHRANDVPAGTVLAGSIDPLQDNQQTVAAIGVELSLQFGDAGQVMLELGLRLILQLMRPVKIRIDVGERDFAAGVDLQPLGEVHGNFLFVTRSKTIAGPRLSDPDV